MSDDEEIGALEAAIKTRLAEVCACPAARTDRAPCLMCGKATAIVLIDRPGYRATYLRSGRDGGLEIVDDLPPN